MARWFALSGEDNDSYMCGGASALTEPGRIPVCPACGFKIDTFYVDASFRVKRRDFDLSFTYDGYCIVSRAFERGCLASDLTGASFSALSADADFLVFLPKPIVQFDVSRRNTRFGERCTVCGQFDSVAGAIPPFLATAPTSDFARTDILFGSGNERHPLIIASERAKGSLEVANLSGLQFHEAAT